MLCFHLTRWKNTFFGNTAEQVIEDNPEWEAIIDYCAKRAASFIPIFPLFISARFSVCALLISIFISLSWPQKYVKGQWNTNWSLGQARQMMKQDTLILQWPVNFEWVKNSCTLDIVYKHNNAERSLAVHWIHSTKSVVQTDCTIWQREFLENSFFVQITNYLDTNSVCFQSCCVRWRFQRVSRLLYYSMFLTMLTPLNIL